MELSKAYVLCEMEDYITKCVDKKNRITQILKSRSCVHYVVGADLEFVHTCMRRLHSLKDAVSSLADRSSIYFSEEDMRTARLPFRHTLERLEAIYSHCIDMDLKRTQQKRDAENAAAPTEQAVVKEQLHALLRRLEA
jgi:hypothetical protein